jgi:TatD DNase family protein
LVIHCRDAHEETLKILKEHRADEVGGVFHCYAKSAEYARQLRDLNFLVSITGVVTFKNADRFRQDLAKIPLEQIMLETDCPYMSPEPFRKDPSEPMHVRTIAEKVAEVYQLPVEEIARVTTDTACKFFGIET